MKTLFVFDYLKKKHRSTLRKLAVLNFVLLMLIFFSIFTILISADNIYKNVLTNERLSMVLINGYSKTGEYEYDTDKIKRMPNVKDIVYEYDVSLSIEADGETDILSALSFNPTTKEAVSYEGDLKENTILLPERFKGKKIKAYDGEVEPLEANIEYYKGEGNYFLKDYSYLSPDLYKKMSSQIKIGENYDGVRTLIVNLNKTEDIYEFVNQFDRMFDEEDVFVYYQAQGLEKLVANSKLSFLLLVVFQIILFVVIAFIYRGQMHTLISILNRDLLSLYLNGMSPKDMIKQFYRSIDKMNLKVYIVALLFIAVLGAFLLGRLPGEIILWIGGTAVGLLLVLVLLNKWFVRYIITKRMKKELSQENIVSRLRN
ncbi:hypothetical protein [Bacillus zhangzhouensis]|uniref:ABC transporter permease n=2 Tax=Bacillus zhangzhouensis TaxID=1178540 RepID=A0A081L763_9BACI|nr:hypothetical protein BA70_12270 [Bacillus zhangzhouensis]